MKNVLLVLALLGFIAPSILVAIESVETGNILLYTNVLATIQGMFSNRISTIFMIDLLFALLVFFYWSYHDSRQYKVKHLGWVWLLTLLFGFAGGLPLYLYYKERTVRTLRKS